MQRAREIRNRPGEESPGDPSAEVGGLKPRATVHSIQDPQGLPTKPCRFKIGKCRLAQGRAGTRFTGKVLHPRPPNISTLTEATAQPEPRDPNGASLDEAWCAMLPKANANFNTHPPKPQALEAMPQRDPRDHKGAPIDAV